MPAASGVTSLGMGYVQQLLGAGAVPLSYLVAVPDGSATGYVVAGAILSQYLALGGPAGSLGYPLSDATTGGRQTFQQGTLAGNPVQLVTEARFSPNGGPWAMRPEPQARPLLPGHGQLPDLPRHSRSSMQSLSRAH